MGKELAVLRQAARVSPLLWFLAVALICVEGCDKIIGPTGLAWTAKSADLSGQVFVVTQAGESVKLGLVPVMAFSSAPIKRHIAERIRQGNKEISLIAPSFAPARQAYDLAIRDSFLAIRHLDAANKALVRAEFAPYEGPSNETVMAQMENAQRAADRRVRAAIKLVDQRLAAVKAIYEKINYFRSSQYLMENLPAPLLATKTDANGEFNMTLPRGGDVVIAAITSRPAMESIRDFVGEA